MKDESGRGPTGSLGGPNVSPSAIAITARSQGDFASTGSSSPDAGYSKKDAAACEREGITPCIPAQSFD